MTTADQIVPIDGEEGIVSARQLARDVARTLGFGTVDQSRIATAVSELARNVVHYATEGRGEVRIRQFTVDGGGAGIEVVVADAGPGIADVDEVLQRGFTSGAGLGMGLPATRRLMDEMEIDTALGRGTTITVRKWRR